MANQLVSDIILNLSGNLAQKARQYGTSMSTFAKTNQRAMNMVKQSTAAAGRGIDRLGNRYVGLATGLATGSAVRNVAAFEAQMTRLGTNAKLTDEEVSALTQSIQEMVNQKDIRIDYTQFATAVDEVLSKSGDLKYVNDNLENMGLFMQAFGVDAMTTAKIFSQFREGGVRDSEAVMKTVDKMYGQFAIGSVSVKELASVSEQLFSTTQLKGEGALTQMSALLQLFAKSKGTAAESVTSIKAVFAAFSDKKKVQFLDRQGIEVFKKGTTELREPVELLLEILDKAKNNPMKLGDVFDTTAKEGLSALYSEDNKQLILSMINGTVELGATQKAAAKNAATFQGAMIALNNEWAEFANERLAEPVKELADAINSVDDETIKTWLKWGEAAVWAVGGLVAAKKGLDLVNAGRRFFGKGGGEGGGKGGGFSDLGAMPVYVVNMPVGGIGGSPGGQLPGGNDGTGPNKKTGRLTKTLGAVATATIVYPVVDAITDYLIGDTDFGQWAKNQKHLPDWKTPVAPTKSQITKAKLDAYLAMNEAGKPSSPLLAGGMMHLGQMKPQELNVHVTASDDRIKVKTSGAAPGLNVDVDTGRSMTAN